MKKLISLVLFAAMLMSVCGFTLNTGAATDTTTTGYSYYYLSSMDANGTTLSADDLAGLGINYYVGLAADGTGILVADDEAPFTYDDTYFYDETGDSIAYTLVGDVLTLTLDDGTMTFTLGDAETPAAPAAGANPSGTITTYRGDAYVEIVGAELFKDSDDKDAVRFYYDFTNMSDQIMYGGYLDTEAEQSGFELVTTYAYYSERVPEDNNSYLDVEPGVTIRCIEEFNCNLNAGGEVTFTISDYGSYPVSATYDLANLPGRPAEDLPIAPITDPTFFAGLPDSFEGEDFSVSIDSAEVVEASRNSSAESVIRVYYTYTNNKTEDGYVGGSGTFAVYQDGVELNTGYARYEIDEDDYYYDDLASGATVSFTRCFELRSDSPVEIVVSDWDDNYAAVVTPIA